MGTTRSKQAVLAALEGEEEEEDNRSGALLPTLSSPNRLRFINQSVLAGNAITSLTGDGDDDDAQDESSTSALGRLWISFETMFHPLFLNDPLVLVRLGVKGSRHCSSFTLFRGTRVCSSRAFLRMHYHVLYALHNLSVVASPSQPREKEKENEEDQCCPICMDRTVDLALSCGHALCAVCEAEWMELRQTCPLCRAVQRVDDGWVLEAHAQQPEPPQPPDTNVNRHTLSIELFTLLARFPTVARFREHFPFRMPASDAGEEDDEAMGKWLESQLMQEGVRCVQCGAQVRVPPSTQPGDRLVCLACRSMLDAPSTT